MEYETLLGPCAVVPVRLSGVRLSIPKIAGDYDVFAAGEAKDRAIAATEWLRARSRPLVTAI